MCIILSNRRGGGKGGGGGEGGGGGGGGGGVADRPAVAGPGAAGAGAGVGGFSLQSGCVLSCPIEEHSPHLKGHRCLMRTD